MSVLPYSVRRFVRRNITWHNIRFQWVIIGMAVGLTGYAIAKALETVIPVIPFLIILLAGHQTGKFLWAAYEFPNPTDYPWAVRKYDDLQHWWTKVSQPARIGTFEGKSVLERWVFNDFRYIYDHTGRLIATEQTINWSDTEPDWRIGDPEDTQTIVKYNNTSERLPWLARLRSPKLPAGNQAEVIDSDGTIVGHTTYRG